MLRRLIILTVAAWFSAATTSGPSDDAAAAPAVRSLGAWFGIFKRAASGERSFVETRLVPHLADQPYCWVIGLETNRRLIHWREEVIAPSAPATWGAADPTTTRTLSDDGRRAVTEGDTPLKNGRLFHCWVTETSDPVGRYSIRVIIENRIEHVFDFDIE